MTLGPTKRLKVIILAAKVITFLFKVITFAAKVITLVFSFFFNSPNVITLVPYMIPNAITLLFKVIILGGQRRSPWPLK